ncbi:MAG: YigZ family protein, partial [Pseudomonadota bacterium]|nr:YigZ family protein [Pseudomonadota bacterium]
TRYFGGIKLGAGGLVRAYSQAVVEALDQLVWEEIYPRQTVFIKIAYPIMGKVEYWLENSDIDVEDKQFGENIDITLAVIERTWAEQKQALIDLCQGNITIIESDTE